MRLAGVDVGATNIAAAVVEEGGAVTDVVRLTTPVEGVDALCDAVAHALGRLPAVTAVGLGVPGPVSHDGVLRTAPNLPGVQAPVDLGALVARRLGGLPVVVGNDADCGALGEWAHGAGAGARALLAVWLGTGVGGGLVLDGALHRGAHGSAGELGHVVHQPGGAECACGRRGCLEAYAGRDALERAVRRCAEAGERSSLLDDAAARGRTRLRSGMWARALARGDPVATRLIEQAVAAVGSVLGSVTNLLDLDRIVVGGGLAEKLGQDLVGRIEAAAAAHLLMPEAPPAFALAALGDDAGTVGAAELARRGR